MTTHRSWKYTEVVLISIVAPRAARKFQVWETPGTNRGIGLPPASTTGLPLCTR